MSTLSSEDKMQVDHVEVSDHLPRKIVDIGAEEEDVSITWKTYLAVFALCLPQLYQTYLLSASAFLATSITVTVGGTHLSTWIATIPSIGQAVFAPFFAYASDQFGNRKWWIILPQLCAVAGAIITGRANSIGVVFVGQAFSGVALGTTALLYAVPSEILPRRLRPMAQALVAVAATVGTSSALFTSGGLISAHGPSAWRWAFYYNALVAAAAVILLFIVYTPQKRVVNVPVSFVQKLHLIDIVGNLILAAGLCFLLVGISVGNNPYPWKSVKPILLIILGFVLLICFGVWEYRRKDGILSRDLFANRNFAISVCALFLEGVILFAILVFFPQEMGAIYESRSILIACRTAAFYLPGIVIVLPIGYMSSRFKINRPFLVFGFTMFLGGLIGLSTLKTSQGKIPMVFVAMCGFGFTPILILLVSVTQLATPPDRIATATSILVLSRALGASVGPTFMGSILTNKIKINVIRYIAPEVAGAGLPPASIAAFIPALVAGNIPSLMEIPGVTPSIIIVGVAALKNALVHSFRWIWISTMPFAALGAILVCFLHSSAKQMNHHVDAPFEKFAEANKFNIGNDNSVKNAEV